MTPPGWTALHATALIVGEAGLLLRGASGAGKSSLALALLARAQDRATYAALVADDRVFMRVFHERLAARGDPSFTGKIERRCEGILDVAAAPAAVIRLVVDLVGRADAPARLPEDPAHWTEILGVRLPRVTLDPALGPDDRARATLDSLARRVTAMTPGLRRIMA